MRETRELGHHSTSSHVPPQAGEESHTGMGHVLNDQISK